MRTIRLLIILFAALLLAGCASGQEMAEGLGELMGEGAAMVATNDAQQAAAAATATADTASILTPPAGDRDAAPVTDITPAPPALYQDPTAPTTARVADLLARMTLDEKIAQMAQIEKNSIDPATVAEVGLGSVLSGGGGYPRPNTPQAWAAMVSEFDAAARASRLGIPLLYGFDAIHGAASVDGATIFPHFIGLGATGDAGLVRRVARATAVEATAMGVRWNFGPLVAVPQDIRWGRTYESFSDDPALVAALGAAYVRGLQETGEQGSGGAGGPGSLADPATMLATPKHFIGDGATVWGSSTQNILDTPCRLDQGDMTLDEAAVRQLLLPPYVAALDAGALSVMASFNSWQGEKVHGRADLLTGLLKDELGFRGFVVSDWGGCDQIESSYQTAIARCINAGVDMNMVPYDYGRFHDALAGAVERGEVSLARIDDAVSRILTVKFEMGLFEAAAFAPGDLSVVGRAEHRALAREAVARSLVLLQNENGALPIRSDTAVFVAGAAADDAGAAAGGWTIEWQGVTGQDITGATTLLAGIEAAASDVLYDARGDFDGQAGAASVGIVVLAEKPYSEGVGDREDLRLSQTEIDLIERVAGQVEQTVVVLLSGRPLVITEALPLADAWVAAWLPGSEGAGVADGLFGLTPFTGTLPYSWPRETGGDALFPRGFGLIE